MTESPDPTTSAPSLTGIRIVAAIGAVVAVAVVVAGFSFGLAYGLGALLALPVIPLGLVLAFEAVRGTT